MSISTLASQFPIAQFSEGSGGLVLMKLEAEQGVAEIYLHGAHVVSFRPRGEEPVLWMSGHSEFVEDKAIRGGVPICFPWFGPHPSEPDYPSHGVARLRLWEVRSVVANAGGSTEATLSLSSDDESLALWPYPFTLTLTVTVSAHLEMRLEVHNSGAAPFTFTEALHTYFAVSDIRSVQLNGLDGVEYVDKLSDTETPITQDGPLSFAKETDRPYLDTADLCAIDDPGAKRSIRIGKNGSMTTVVWNPWTEKAGRMADFGDDEWTGMLCVETANALRNAVTLAAGDTHLMEMNISVL